MEKQLNRYNKLNNTVRSSLYGMIFKILNIIGAFTVKTLLINVLGMEFVGIDGLFGSVLKLLNMADMGFSTAVVYKLYKPISENDDSTVRAILLYYRKIYRVVGMIVLLLGLICLPFLRFFVSGDIPDGMNLYLLFLIYLANSAFSYWVFSYKTAVLTATQRNDLLSKVYSAAYILRYALQIIFLLLFKNYYVFCFVIPLTTILSNVGIALVSKKHFPQYFCEGIIAEKDKKDIKTKISSLMYNKLGVALINGSDNIIISAFLGLTILGIYDSYFYIFSMLHSVFDIVHQAITGGIGNSVVTEDSEKNFLLFSRLSFVNYWVVTVASIALFVLYSPFMKIWIGPDNLFDDLFSCIMAIYFFIYMIRFITLIFKNALGMWREDRFRAFVEAGLNLTLNIIAVRFIGIYGITLSTIIAMIVVSVPWETIVLFKNYFKKSASKYFVQLLLGFLIASCIGFATYFIANLIHLEGILGLVYKAIICLVFPNILLFVLFFKTDGFKYIISSFKRIFAKLKRR